MKQQLAFPNGAHDLRRGIDFIGISCAFICHDGKGNLLLHKRSKNCRDEQGKWEFGAGAQEFGETFEETVSREIEEEYGVRPTNLKFVTAHNILRKLDDGTPTHWVGVLYTAQVDPVKVTNNEPYKMDEFDWFTPDNLPSPLHSQAGFQLEALRSHAELLA